MTAQHILPTQLMLYTLTTQTKACQIKSNHINNKEQNVYVCVVDLSDESAPQRKIKELHRFLKTRMHVFTESGIDVLMTRVSRNLNFEIFAISFRFSETPSEKVVQIRYGIAVSIYIFSIEISW